MVDHVDRQTLANKACTDQAVRPNANTDGATTEPDLSPLTAKTAQAVPAARRLRSTNVHSVACDGGKTDTRWT